MTQVLRAPLLPMPRRLAASAVGLSLVLVLTLGLIDRLGSPTSQPASLAMPGGNGMVAFDRDGDIFVVDALDAQPRVLVEGAAEDTDPSWSPDGRNLLFWRIEGETATPMLTDASGAEPLALTSEPLREPSWMSWAPDAHAVAVASMADGQSVITTIPVDGSGKTTQLSVGSQTGMDYPAWSPIEQDRLLYRQPGDPAVLRSFQGLTHPGTADSLVLDAAGMDGVRTTGYGGTYDFLDPAWAPDGGRVAYHALNEVGEHAPDGNGFRVHIATMQACADTCPEPLAGSDTLVEFDPESNDEGFALWSPDGSRLAFQAFDTGQARLVIVTVDPDAPAGIDEAIATDPLFSGVGGLGYAWAPDGSALVLVNREALSLGAYRVDALTGVLEPLDWGSPGWPSWQSLPS